MRVGSCGRRWRRFTRYVNLLQSRPWICLLPVTGCENCPGPRSEGPENFAFARPFFAVHAIACASDIRVELANSALGTFNGNVFKGGMNSNPGEPPPRLLSTKQQAERLRGQFSYWDWGAKLFNGIVKHVDQMIQGFRIDDEEFRFNN